MDMKVAVVGGSGVVGRAILEDLTAAGVSYVALSRRPPDLPDSHFVPLDLNDPAQCQTAASADPSASIPQRRDPSPSVCKGRGARRDG